MLLDAGACPHDGRPCAFDTACIVDLPDLAALHEGRQQGML